MNVMLLHNNHLYVSATHVTMFGLMSTKIANAIIMCSYHCTV